MQLVTEVTSFVVSFASMRVFILAAYLALTL